MAGIDSRQWIWRYAISAIPRELSDRWTTNAIHVLYRPEQVLDVDSPKDFSKSPQKPGLLLEFLSRHGLDRRFVRHDDWTPFQKDDFLLAHTPEYVKAFFADLISCLQILWRNPDDQLPQVFAHLSVI
jgi:hypothetical protein